MNVVQCTISVVIPVGITIESKAFDEATIDTTFLIKIETIDSVSK